MLLQDAPLWQPMVREDDPTKPHPQVLALISPAEVLFYGGAAGGGKLLALDTPIPTPEGWVTMGEIEAGQIVFDETGAPCVVVAAHAIDPSPECYRLTFSDGTTIDAGGDHRWRTQTLTERSRQMRATPEARAQRRQDRASRGTGARPDLDDQYRGEPAPMPVHGVRTTEEISRSLLVGTRVNHSIEAAGPIQCDPNDLPIDPYLFGCWLGDGSSYKAEIATADEPILEAFAAGGYRVAPRTSKYSYGVNGGLLVALRGLGVLRNKHIPAIYLRGSIDQRLALLQGLCDTDGTVEGGGQCSFTTTKRALADGVHELLMSLGIKARIQEGWAKLDGRVISKKYALKFLTKLPAFRLPRKLIKQKRHGFRGTHRRRYIVGCERIPTVPMRCITVSSASQLYLCGRSMVPTHNTDLLIGLGLLHHLRSIIFRREFGQLAGIIDRMEELIGNRKGYNSQRSRWRRPGRVIEFGACQYLGDEQRYQGRPHDAKLFDEITGFLEKQFRFLIGWRRTARPGQRTRVVCAGNPPTDAEGQWVIKYWGPWLDPDHPRPAKPGELRWFVVIKGEDVEVPNGDVIESDEGEQLQPHSRTFIPSKVEDNPYLTDTGYRATLEALPEPLRSQMLYADFQAGMQDDAYQVIPTKWVMDAQARWRANPRRPKGVPMTTLGFDCARGGEDENVLTPRYEHWFGEQHIYPGIATPDGAAGAALAMTHLRDGAMVNIDVIGIGSSVYDTLNTNGVPVEPINVSKATKMRDKSGSFGFFNLRSYMWWAMREALDPSVGMNLCLPDDRQLRVDLCTPRFKVGPRGIQVEAKEDSKKRIGRSPDRGDSAVYALADPLPKFNEPLDLYGSEDVEGEGSIFGVDADTGY